MLVCSYSIFANEFDWLVVDLKKKNIITFSNVLNTRITNSYQMLIMQAYENIIRVGYLYDQIKTFFVVLHIANNLF